MTPAGTPAELLTALGACQEAIDWAERYETAAAAWNACVRADWMIWYLVRSGAPTAEVAALLLDLVDASATCRRIVGERLRGVGPIRGLAAVTHEEAWILYYLDREDSYTAAVMAHPGGETTFVNGHEAVLAISQCDAAAAVREIRRRWQIPPMPRER